MKLITLLVTLLTLPVLYAQPLIIGTLPFNPPFETMADSQNHFFGFDIDIMSEVCNRMQADCHFIPLTFEKLFTQTLSGEIDIAIAAISITEARQEDFLFSLPYLASSGQFIAKTASSIQTGDDLREKRVGILQGTIFKAIAIEKFNGVVQIIEYGTLPEVFDALMNDAIDAALVDKGAADYWVASNNVMFKLVGKEIPIGIGYGMMTNKKGSTLIQTINKILMNMESDGTYLKIYGRYFSQM